MSRMVFELAISVLERAKKFHALNLATTVIGSGNLRQLKPRVYIISGKKFLWYYDNFDFQFDLAVVLVVSIIKGLTSTMFCEQLTPMTRLSSAI
jgi:hypothetical protein